MSRREKKICVIGHIRGQVRNNGAEDDDPNEENSALKYDNDHSIPSDILHNHILYGNVAQYGGGLKSKEGDIVLSSISETINNDTADTKHDFKDLNKDVPPPQDLPKQPNDPLAQKAADMTTTSVAASGAQVTPPNVAAFELDAQSITDNQVSAKQARRTNVLYSGKFWEKH